MVRKTLDFLKSMKFGLILLGILCFFSIIGSVIPQGHEEAFYLNNYPPLWSQLIISFEAYDLYHSTGFIVLFFALALNLFLCSTLRLKNVIKKIIESSISPTQLQLKNPIATYKPVSPDTIYAIFINQGFKNVNYKKDNTVEIYTSNKNKVGYLGSWLIHLGILAIIVFYSYGQYTFTDTAVYGVPGSVQEIEGTDMIMTIDDFEIRYREDGSVAQYVTQGTLADTDGNHLVSGEIYVNNPMRYKGYTFYQHSTGWALEVNVSKDNEILGNEVLYDGTAYINNQEYMIIQMHHFYPDFIATETGFASQSNNLHNPKILYALIYGGQRVAMNVVSLGEDVHWQDFSFSFTKPQRYTYLSVNKMHGKTGAILGSAVIILGLLLTFYVKPKQLIIAREKETISIYGDYSLDKQSNFKGNYRNKKDISI